MSAALQAAFFRLLRTQLPRPTLSASVILRRCANRTPSVAFSDAAVLRPSHAHIAPSPKPQSQKPTRQLPQIRNLPRSCPGCGALAQLEQPELAGYYNT